MLSRRKEKKMQCRHIGVCGFVVEGRIRREGE